MMGTQTPIYEPQEDLTMAEGYAEAEEGHESVQHQHRLTTELPMVRHQKYNLAAETGLVAMVSLGGEGKDDDEAQDASLTGGETTTPHVSATTSTYPLITQAHLSLTDTPTADESATVADMIPTPQSENMVSASLTSKTVLIVEDQQELAEVLIATLERMKLKTVHETHGDKAVARFLEMNPDIMLLDITLPDTTGWKIMDAIKERLDSTNGDMPKVIVITALDDPANRLIGKLQGVHSYLIKPFTADEIETIVMKALDISPAS
ncbi:MAG: response regulator [Phototrophicales bacterium]|nr:response regulator [Phototrophicales bacterium]